MPDQIEDTPFRDVYQGFAIGLPAEDGERHFVQVAFGTEEGIEVSHYDTRGMVIDAENHIQAADRLAGYPTHEEVVAYLVERCSLQVGAKASGRDISVEFTPRGVDLKDGDRKVAGLTFPARGGVLVEVVRSADGTSVRGRWSAVDWADAADILGGYGYEISASAMAPAPAPPRCR